MLPLRHTYRITIPLLVAAAFASSLSAQTPIIDTQTSVKQATVLKAVATPRPTSIGKTDRAVRLQLSGSLQMLSQRISAAACNSAAEIAVSEADLHLTRALRDYRRILSALSTGDPGLGLYGPETDPAVLRALADIQTHWAPVNKMFETAKRDALTFHDAVKIAAIAPKMHKASEQLVGVIAAQYPPPHRMLQSDAIILQISERQRVLEQKISNAACMITDNIDKPLAQQRLTDAVQMYEVSLSALRRGMPNAGVAAPPTVAIALWLNDITKRWKAVRPILKTIGDGGLVTNADRETVFVEMNKLTWMTNIIVQQYTEAHKLRFWTGGAS